MNLKLSCDLCFRCFLFVVDQVITRGGGLYLVDMYTSFLKELRLSFRSVAVETVLLTVPAIIPFCHWKYSTDVLESLFNMKLGQFITPLRSREEESRHVQVDGVGLGFGRDTETAPIVTKVLPELARGSEISLAHVLIHSKDDTGRSYGILESGTEIEEGGNQLGQHSSAWNFVLADFGMNGFDFKYSKLH